MTPGEPRESPQPMYHFTVRRGMTVVLVIETTYWYAGLLQAALVRIAVEGRN